MSERPQPVRKPSIGLFSSASTPSKPAPERPQLAPPGPTPDIEPEPTETATDAPEADPDDRAEVLTIRLYRRQRDRLAALQKTLVPGLEMGQSAAIRWLIDHWTK